MVSINIRKDDIDVPEQRRTYCGRRHLGRRPSAAEFKAVVLQPFPCHNHDFNLGSR
jgi:hypothetical protein